LSDTSTPNSGVNSQELRGLLTRPMVRRHLKRVRANEAITRAERAHHPFSLAEALSALGAVYVAQGNLDLAIDALGRGLALSRESQTQPWATLSRLGYAYALSGRLPEALGLLEEVAARSVPTMSAMGLGRAIQLAWLAETYLLDGRLGDAVGRAQQAMSLSQRHHERGHEAWSLRLLGEIDSHADSPDVEATEAHYRQAMDLAIELGLRPLVAHCHLGLGKLYRCTGKREQAQEHLTTATTMYREMDMRFWLEQGDGDGGTRVTSNSRRSARSLTKAQLVEEVERLRERLARTEGPGRESNGTEETERFRRELAEALEQQTATSEILQVISQSPTDVQLVFDAILSSAVQLCDGTFGVVQSFDGELIHIAAHQERRRH